MLKVEPWRIFSSRSEVECPFAIGLRLEVFALMPPATHLSPQTRPNRLGTRLSPSQRPTASRQGWSEFVRHNNQRSGGRCRINATFKSCMLVYSHIYSRMPNKGPNKTPPSGTKLLLELPADLSLDLEALSVAHYGAPKARLVREAIQNFIADPAKLKSRVLQACRDSVSRFPLDERSAKINPLFSAVPVLVSDRDYLHPRLCAL